MKKAATLFVLVLCYSISYGQFDSAQKMKQRLPLIKDSMQYVDALNRVAMLMYENSLDSTFYYAARAREIANRINYLKGKADAVNNLGIVYDLRGNQQLSLRYYNEASMLYKGIHDTANVVQTKMNIASVYFQSDQPQKALSGFKEAFEIGKSLKQDSIMSLLYYNYVMSFPDRLPKDSAAVYVNRIVRIATKYKDTRVLLATEQLRARYEIEAGQISSGIKRMQRTLQSTLDAKLYYLSLDMVSDLSRIFMTIDSAKALGYYRQGFEISKQKGYRVYAMSFVKSLYDFYKSAKNTDEAFIYSQQLVELYDEKDKMDRDSGVDYIEYALKEQQLETVRTKSKYQSGFLALAGVVCVMTIILIVVFWRNWKRTQQTAEALRLQFLHSEATMAELDVMNKDYARLIKIVAHDLRNPIGAIGSLTTLISADKLGEEDREFLTLIHASSKNCLELINELMKTDFNEQLKLKIETIDINELMVQCVLLLGFKAREKDQELLLDSHVEGAVAGDVEKLMRVINNLLSNAIKFSEPQSTIQVSVMSADREVLIKVKDEGMGIPVELQDKIFDPFTTSRRKGTSGEQPFGLGLYISKQIIEAHRGRIWFETENNQGTTFFVALPV